MGNLREIVNGKLLQRFSGKNVSLVGLVTSSSPDGSSFELKSVDGVNVKINMKQPNDGPLSGYVMVFGVPQKTTLLCDEVIHWDNYELDFDEDSYNHVCSMLNSNADMWTFE